MLELAPLLKVFPIFVAALISPGPDFMIVSSVALSRGRVAGIQAAAGIATGVLFYVVLSLMGLAAIFEHMLGVAMAIKIAGGLYLCYLGLMLWKSAASEHEAAVPKNKGKNAFAAGLLTNLTNPKAIAFFASVFAVALTPNTSAKTKLAFVAGSWLITMFWFSLVAACLSSPALTARYQEWRKTIDRVSGSLLMLFGLKLVLSAND